MSKYYPDISHHEKVTDWNKVRKACPFIITKATQGLTFIDPLLGTVIKECEKRKKPYWLYAYLNSGKELAQAKFLVETCRERVGKYFVGYILDVECKEGNNVAGVRDALKYIQAADTVHHVKHVRDYPELALSAYYYEQGTKRRQLVAICKECHALEHPEKLKNHKTESLTVERW